MMMDSDSDLEVYHTSDGQSDLEGYHTSDGQSDLDKADTCQMSVRVRLLSWAPVAALAWLEHMSKGRTRLMNRLEHLVDLIHPLMR